MANKPRPSSGVDWLDIWQRRSWAARALWPLSWLYGTAWRMRRAFYQLDIKTSTHLPVPVVVVGNVVVGGAGKTPSVIALVRHLQDRGWTPGVVSRGYGRQGDGCQEVTPTSTSSEVGDEPSLIARATCAPMVVGRLRVQAAALLLRKHPQVNIIVSDDGMQHWSLARDLTVVVFDERGTGNGWLLPAGMLREPWPCPPWGKGHMLVLRTQDAATPEESLPPLASPYPVYRALRGLNTHALNCREERMPLALLAQKSSLGALAGIAQPSRFFQMLKTLGLPLQRECALSDHAGSDELLSVLQPGVTWLCTEKDAVKLFPMLSQRPDLDVWAVPLQQTPEPAFFGAIDQALEGLSSPHGRQTP